MGRSFVELLRRNRNEQRTESDSRSRENGQCLSHNMSVVPGLKPVKLGGNVDNQNFGAAFSSSSDRNVLLEISLAMADVGYAVKAEVQMED